MSKTVKNLLIINVAAFICIHIFPAIDWLGIFGLAPRYVFSGLRLWQFVTYLFLHIGLFHLSVNMLMLYFFAPAIEKVWGAKRFLFYYFFTGIGAGLCSVLLDARSTVPVVGASGAIFGLLVAFALLFPETVILVFFVFPMRIRPAVLFFAVFNLLGALSAAPSGIAYYAHLGGALFGYLYFQRDKFFPPGYLRRFFVSGTGKRAKKGEPPEPMTGDTAERVDAILDKISAQGMRSLTQKERKILETQSKKK